MYETMIEKAIGFAWGIHAKEFRKRYNAGIRLPYITHPLEVAKKVWMWGAGTPDMMATAVLHDTLESLHEGETEYILSDFDMAIEKEFGRLVAAWVQELSFLPPNVVNGVVLTPQEKKKMKAEYLQSFATKSVASLVIKIADRICNSLNFFATDPKYAAKYFNCGLMDIACNRQQEIEAEFGEDVFAKMKADWLSVKIRADYQQGSHIR